MLMTMLCNEKKYDTPTNEFKTVIPRILQMLFIYRHYIERKCPTFFKQIGKNVKHDTINQKVWGQLYCQIKIYCKLMIRR